MAHPQAELPSTLAGLLKSSHSTEIQEALGQVLTGLALSLPKGPGTQIIRLKTAEDEQATPNAPHL